MWTCASHHGHHHRRHRHHRHRHRHHCRRHHQHPHPHPQHQHHLFTIAIFFPDHRQHHRGFQSHHDRQGTRIPHVEALGSTKVFIDSSRRENTGSTDIIGMRVMGVYPASEPNAAVEETAAFESECSKEKA